MEIKDKLNIVKEFFENENLRKYKGILVKGCSTDEDCDSTIFSYSSKEEFFNNQCEWIYTYDCKDFEKRELFNIELNDVQEQLEDAFSDYIDNLMTNQKISVFENSQLEEYYRNVDLSNLIIKICGEETF